MVWDKNKCTKVLQNDKIVGDECTTVYLYITFFCAVWFTCSHTLTFLPAADKFGFFFLFKTVYFNPLPDNKF